MGIVTLTIVPDEAEADLLCGILRANDVVAFPPERDGDSHCRTSSEGRQQSIAGGGEHPSASRESTRSERPDEPVARMRAPTGLRVEGGGLRFNVSWRSRSRVGPRRWLLLAGTTPFCQGTRLARLGSPGYEKARKGAMALPFSASRKTC